MRPPAAAAAGRRPVAGDPARARGRRLVGPARAGLSRRGAGVHALRRRGRGSRRGHGPIRRGERAGLPPRLDRPLPRPRRARAGPRNRRRADDGPAPVRRPRPPPDHHRPHRGEPGGDPGLREGGLPPRRHPAGLRAGARRPLARRAADGAGRAATMKRMATDAETLRSTQAPLKARYREDPEAAVVTLRAGGTLGEGVSCSVQTGRALAEAGLHPATGGDGSLLCSGDMLLEALVACAGVTLRAVATSLGIPVPTGRVHAEGDLDFRGTLGVDREAQVGFREIRLGFELETEADEEQLATLLKL